MTTQERLTECRENLAVARATYKKLLGKTNQSVSFGDQTYSLANLEGVKKQINELIEEERVLESILSGGTRRRTIKIGFPSC